MKEIGLKPRQPRAGWKRVLVEVIKGLGPKGVVIVENNKHKEKKEFARQIRQALKEYFPEETFFIYPVPDQQRQRWLIRPYSCKRVANVEPEQEVFP